MRTRLNSHTSPHAITSETYVTLQPVACYTDAQISSTRLGSIDAGKLVISAHGGTIGGFVRICEPLAGWVRFSWPDGSPALQRARAIRVKYAIIGAGQTGLQFLHHCATRQCGSVAIVDSRTAIGGHWLESYDFVRLHAPKATYGIDVTRWTGDAVHDLASRAEILDHYAVTMGGILGSEMVEGMLGHTAERIMTTAYGSCVLCTSTTHEQPTLLIASGIIDATLNAVPWNDPVSLDATSDVRARAIGPAGLPMVDISPSTRFVVVGGGKSACDAVLHLRRRLGLPPGQDSERIVWIISTPLAFFRRDVLTNEIALPLHQKMADEHTRTPKAKLSEMTSYSDLFHHFTTSLPETTHFGILSCEELLELRGQSRLEGRRAVLIGRDSIKLSDGQTIACDDSTVVITCTGPRVADEVAFKRSLKRAVLMQAPQIDQDDIDAVTLFPFRMDFSIARSNHFLAELFFSNADPMEALSAIKRSVSFMATISGRTTQSDPSPQIPIGHVV